MERTNGEDYKWMFFSTMANWVPPMISGAHVLITKGSQPNGAWDIFTDTITANIAEPWGFNWLGLFWA